MASSSSSSSSFSLSPAHVDAFSRDGFVVLPSFWSPATIARVRGAADALLASYDPATTPRSVFSTDEQQRHSDAYFLASGDNVSFFFEAEAVDASTGALLVPKERAINKIGHNLHELVPAFREVSLEDARRRHPAAQIGDTIADPLPPLEYGRIAAQSAFISTGYLRVGLSGDYGIAWLLTRLVGTARARELIAHHEERCAVIARACRDTPRSAAELVPVLFHRPLDPHQMSFAFSETLAHVNYMLRRGSLTWADRADGVERVVAASDA